MRLPLLIVLLCAAGCSDWNLFRRSDPPCADCDDPDEPTCDPLELPGQPLQPVDCRPEQGPLTARELWRVPAGGIVAIVPDPAQPRGEGEVVVLVHDTNDETGWLRALDGRTGEVRWSMELGQAAGLRLRVGNSEDLDRLDIFSATGDVGGTWSRIDANTGIQASWGMELGGELRKVVDETCVYGVIPELGDLDGDGLAEIVLGPMVLGPDLKIIANGGFRPPAICQSTVADMTGDGQGEFVTEQAIYHAFGSVDCRLPYSQEGYIYGQIRLADLDGDNRPEVVQERYWWGDAGNDIHKIEVADHTCAALPLSPILPENLSDANISGITIIAPLLERGRPAFWATIGGTLPDGTTFTGAAVMDHNLRVVRTFPNRYRSAIRAADFDGDGLFEVLGPWGLQGGTFSVIDPRTGEVRLTLEGEDPFPVDVDGDGQLEIVASTGVAGIDSEVVAYNAAEGEWAWGTRTWNQRVDFYPGLYLPDGGMAPPGRDWSRIGWFNAAPDDGYLRGAYGELTVRVAEVCDAACDQGRLHAWVHVGNAGIRDVERPVRVELGTTRGSEEVVLAKAIFDELPAQTEQAAIDMVVTDMTDVDNLWVRVVPDGWRWEGCTELPDVDLWEGELCGG